MIRTAVNGSEGTYAYTAAVQMLGAGLSLVLTTGFGKACDEILAGRADRAVLPLRNSIVGNIDPALKAIRSRGLSVEREHELAIEHVLVGHPRIEVDRLRTVVSHPAALAQCSSFLNRNPQLRTVAVTDTATAIRQVMNGGDPAWAAICSESAAELYGASILRRHIADADHNTTIFGLIAKRGK